MIPIQETIYYQDASPVFISSERMIFFTQTIFTRSIVSVSVGPFTPKRTSAVILGSIGLVLLLMGMLALSPPKNDTAVLITDVVVLLAGIIFLIWGILRYLTVDPYHALEIGTPSGLIRAIVSPDYAYINTLKTAVEQAIHAARFNNP